MNRARTWSEKRPWAEARAAQARETVRRAVIESLAAVWTENPRPSSDYENGFETGAITVAATILRRLGLRGIGLEIVAGIVRDMQRRGGRALPEARR